MTSRSPAKARIIAAALEHFSIRGYDAASLGEIADKVGIRKASLYSHFDSKDDLFLQALADAVGVETAHAEAVFAAASASATPGEAYVASLGERHAGSVHLRFLLRAVFHHPVALKAAIGEAYEGFAATLRDRFADRLRGATPLAEAEETARLAHAYVGVIESLFVELNFESREKMEIRRDALWRLMTDSLNAPRA